MQQHLEAKRGALEKSLEQLVGQINRVNGAIAMVDELIAESKAREEAQAAAPPVLHDRHGNVMTMEQMDAMMGYVAPSAPTMPLAEMLPVVSGDAEDEQRGAPGAA